MVWPPKLSERLECQIQGLLCKLTHYRTTQPDGTVIPGTVTETHWYKSFVFAATPESELAAVVARVDGRLSVWPLSGAQEK